jgi:hypothetical protein
MPAYLSAFGAKRTCRDRRWRIHRTRLTHSGHGQANFPVMHNATFQCVPNTTCPEELRRLHHRRIVCVFPNEIRLGRILGSGLRTMLRVSRQTIAFVGTALVAALLSLTVSERRERIRQHTAA